MLPGVASVFAVVATATVAQTRHASTDDSGGCARGRDCSFAADVDIHLRQPGRLVCRALISSHGQHSPFRRLLFSLIAKLSWIAWKSTKACFITYVVAKMTLKRLPFMQNFKHSIVKMGRPAWGRYRSVYARRWNCVAGLPAAATVRVKTRPACRRIGVVGLAAAPIVRERVVNYVAGLPAAAVVRVEV